jgi:hypothetical protein
MNALTLQRPIEKSEAQQPTSKPVKLPMPKHFTVEHNDLKVPLRLGVYQYREVIYLNGSLRYSDPEKLTLSGCSLRHRLLGHTDNLSVISACYQDIEQLVHQYFPHRDWQFLGVDYQLQIKPEFN